MRRIIAILAAVSMIVTPAVPAEDAGHKGQQPGINAPPEHSGRAASPGQQSHPEQTVIRSSVDLVLIDARVTDRSGKPILGLKPEDFSLTEDGHPQKISSLDYNNIEGVERATVASAAPLVVPMGTIPPPKPEAIRSAVRDHRLIVLFFDLTALHPDDLIRAQEGAEDYIAKQMSPADLVGVAVFGNQLKVPVHFTNNKEVLMRAIKRLRAGKDAELADMADAAAQPGEDTTSEDTGAAFTADETEFNIFNTDRKLAALQSLAILLRDIPGRKSVVQFTGGIVQTGDENRAQLVATTDAANRANVSFYTVDARGLFSMPPGGEAREGSSAGSAMFIGSGKATIAHQASRAVFSGAEVFHESASRHNSRETLSTLASDTGGRSFFDLGEFSDVFKKIQSDSPGYYLIGYNSTDTRENGAWRRVRVKVSVRGARVQSRPGYYAAHNFGQATSEDRERQLMDAMRDEAPRVELPVALETCYFRLSDQNILVPIAAKLPSSALDWAQKRGRRQAVFDFAAEVRDAASSKVVAALRDQITVTLGADRFDRLQKQSLVYQGGVVLGPGNYKLKFLVRENESGRIGSFEEDLTLPEAQHQKLELSPMLLSGQIEAIQKSSEVSKKTLGRETKLKSSPLEYSGQRIVPSVTRVFTRQQQLYVFFQAYLPGKTDPSTMRAGLVFFRGGRRGEETQLAAPAEVDDKTHTASFRINLPLEKLEPGAYTVQAVVVQGGGDLAAFARNSFELRTASP
jgi:VWFA-related protein